MELPQPAAEPLIAVSHGFGYEAESTTMPGLVRKLLIFAAVDGLVLQPAPPRNHKPATEQAIKITYKTNAISPLLKDRRDEETAPLSLETHGIVGLLKVASSAFLISISGREQVAQIRGKPIYVITDVALIPLFSQLDAENALAQARETLRRRARSANDDDEDTSDSDTVDDYDTRSLHEDSLPSTPPPEPEKGDKSGSGHKRRTSVAEDVIGKKGLYGRFADKWFSRSGWNYGGRRMQGMSSDEDLASKQKSQSLEAPLVNDDNDKEDATQLKPAKDDKAAEDQGAVAPEQVAETLAQPTSDSKISYLPKVLRTTKLYFGSRSFFFSYDYDVSRDLAKQSVNVSSIPLFQTFDPLFFWNRHIMKPFISAGQNSFVLPVLQGFVGQRAFSVDMKPDAHRGAIIEASTKAEEAVAAQEEAAATTSSTPSSGESSMKKDFLLTLISRRSTKRAGLRYLRRGVDNEGNVANSVETEQILSSQPWDAVDKVYSYTQYRGSIPLFFSQSPYSLKPIPTFYGSQETNEAAFKLHFHALAARYGGVQAASLVDKHGTEATIGETYEKHANILNEKGGIDGKGTKLGFEWFDFHNVCRGMKFENVSVLMDTLGPTLSSHGWTVQQNSQLLHTQSGVLRTNCMDCLDRTNVVQSACARSALEQQLAAEGLTIDLQTDPTTSWFNTLWADNGDAISKQYSGTAALKGDYTRTRRRKISGALADFSLTLSRYYNNIVNDYFAQAVVDYLLGRATDAIFAEFEADMKAQDYAVDLRKVRQNAIDVCAKIAIEDTSEDLVAGWTLSCPHEPHTLRTMPFEECVLLLTEKALYFCRFDWGTEKVREFERVELERVRKLARGTYITSTLAQRHMDEKKNVGLVVGYTAGGDEGVRVNTRSLTNEKEPEGKKGKKSSQSEMKFWAFKALPPRSSFIAVEGQEEQPLSEVEMVQHVCEEIKRVADAAQKTIEAGRDEGKDDKSSQEGLVIEEKDIISLADARKSTGYLEQLGYSLKKLVWV